MYSKNEKERNKESDSDEGSVVEETLDSDEPDGLARSGMSEDEEFEHGTGAKPKKSSRERPGKRGKKKVTSSKSAGKRQESEQKERDTIDICSDSEESSSQVTIPGDTESESDSAGSDILSSSGSSSSGSSSEGSARSARKKRRKKRKKKKAKKKKARRSGKDTVSKAMGKARRRAEKRVEKQLARAGKNISPLKVLLKACSESMEADSRRMFVQALLEDNYGPDDEEASWHCLMQKKFANIRIRNEVVAQTMSFRTSSELAVLDQKKEDYEARLARHIAGTTEARKWRTRIKAINGKITRQLRMMLEIHSDHRQLRLCSDPRAHTALGSVTTLLAQQDFSTSTFHQTLKELKEKVLRDVALEMGSVRWSGATLLCSPTGSRRQAASSGHPTKSRGHPDDVQLDKRICHDYNKVVGCHWDQMGNGIPCRFIHICNRCRGPHAAPQCPEWRRTAKKKPHSGGRGRRGGRGRGRGGRGRRRGGAPNTQ